MMVTTVIRASQCHILHSIRDATAGIGHEFSTSNHVFKMRYKIDKSRVPKLCENDLEEKYVHGSGPGGQCVNKSYNACQLRHLPTNIVVKVHQSRDLQENRLIARQMIVDKLDQLYNGEQSVHSQKRKIAMKMEAVKDEGRTRLETLKKIHKSLLLNRKKERLETTEDPI